MKCTQCGHEDHDSVSGQVYVMNRRAMRRAAEALRANMGGAALAHLENALIWSPDGPGQPNGADPEK